MRCCRSLRVFYLLVECFCMRAMHAEPRTQGSQVINIIDSSFPKLFLKRQDPLPHSLASAFGPLDTKLFALRGGNIWHSPHGCSWPLDPKTMTKTMTKVGTIAIGMNCLQGNFWPVQYRKRYQMPSSACLEVRSRYLHFTTGSASHVLAAALLLFLSVCQYRAPWAPVSCFAATHPSVPFIREQERSLISIPLDTFTVAKGLSVLAGLNGLAMLVAPSAMDQFCGFSTFSSNLKINPATFLNRYMGSIILGYATFCFCVANSGQADHSSQTASLNNAMVYASVPPLLFLLVQNVVTRHVDELDMAAAHRHGVAGGNRAVRSVLERKNPGQQKPELAQRAQK